jgi:hypothetical protein
MVTIIEIYSVKPARAVRPRTDALVYAGGVFLSLNALGGCAPL